MFIKLICLAAIGVIWNFNCRTRYNQYFTNISITFFFQQRHVPWILTNIMIMKCLLFKNSGHRFFYDCLSEILCKLLYTHPLLGAHVISKEGNGLILGQWHSQGHDHMLVVFVLLLLEETIVTLQMFLWRFPFNFIWKCTIMLSKNSWHLVLEIKVY
jgi:hypothetical protein